MTAPIRVLIVDDHAVVREGIRHILTADPGFTVIAEAADTESAVCQARTDPPDVILLDITMPGEPGFAAVPRLVDAAPGARVLMLSVHDDNEYVLRSVRAGAHGYLRKDTTPAELRRAIRALHEGGGFFSPSAARHVTAALQGTTPGPDAPSARQALASLTAREREVLALIAEGLINKEIASRLGISVRTVESHRDNLGRKLHVRTGAQLTRLAVESGLTHEGPESPT